MFNGIDIHPLRTVIINAITAGVAFGLARNRLSHPPLMPVTWPGHKPAPRVEIIVPARNEERNIARLLQSLVAQQYPSQRWGVTVVDDYSTDGTAAIAEHFAAENPNVRLIRARELPSGWTGKNNAMFSAYMAAPSDTRYLLFVDADTEYVDHMLSSIVLAAQQHGAALLSLVLNVPLRTFWQRLLVPQMGELYALVAGTMDAVNRVRGPAAANGQCMLVSYDGYSQYAGLPEVRGDVAEDRALAAAMKRGGESIRLEHGERLGKVRPYETFHDAWAGYTKTLYWATGRSTARTFVVLFAFEMYAHLPLLDLARGFLRPSVDGRRRAIRHAAFRLFPMLALRLYVCRQLNMPAVYAVLYPLAVAAGNAMLLASWLAGKSRRGVSWKGRRYT
jgi:chlorobactene glucosyltransferase